MRVNILVADKYAIVRLGILVLIEELNIKASVFQASNCKELIYVLKTHSIDLLVCDSHLPDDDDFIEEYDIKIIWPRMKILIFLARIDDVYTLKYAQSGAHSYLYKDASGDEIKKAIGCMIDDGQYMDQVFPDLVMKQKLKNKHPLEQLSKRELEVAKLLANGSSLLEIASSLNLQSATVCNYKRRLYEKLQINNFADLIAITKELFE